ncbi:conserved exported hypothetical protein [Vibrio coralliirubri]|nr:conserved exported hypothetical protein [Vibrio coralliirubri]
MTVGKKNMLAALSFKNIQWVKWLLIAAVGVAMTSMWLMLKASKAEQAALRARLDTALSVNQVSQATIETLTQESSAANQLLVDRARLHSSIEEQLNDDIETLRGQLADNACYQKPWPSPVTDRLRQPY